MIKKLIMVVLLLAIGLGIFIFFKQPTETITIGTYDAVPTIEANLQMMTIEVSSSPDDKIHVVVEGKKGVEEQFSIDHDETKLLVKENNEKQWNDFITIGSQPKIIMQIPTALENSVSISNKDGDSYLKGLDVKTVQVKSSTGRVTLRDINASTSELNSTDGNVTVHNSEIENGSISTTSGNVNVRESKGTTLAAQSVDGQIKLTEATEQSDVRLKSKTGDIQVIYKTAPSSLKLSTSGEIVKVELPSFDQKTGIIGKGTNILSIETKDGMIQVK
ncbi:hypothetical protein NCCP2222_28980 [Sporosarcina sp. NCCP-2222]|uniref:DUF4097 family beta strand repeat-containing protein n=1 Tax=Sporosarcina sp. NCCP-2222 TaxID=2935073 RepID=UPI0020817DDC|nr:DUF4097 family beta strand repeat-containing protein [Sporosarcina sp. NCCP-2222]GKV56951.1 hypothetical protein NCCP2222_28980 [Sporosarcina sp. NCCP-2222]